MATQHNKNQQIPLFGERIVRKHELHQLTGISESMIWRLEHKGQFPARVSLGERAVGWRYSEVIQWLAVRESKRAGTLPKACA